MILRKTFLTLLLTCVANLLPLHALTLNEKEYYEAPAWDVLVFSNWYNGLFSDSKISGIEFIHFGERTATNGDVRLDATPEQWDAIPTFVSREVDSKTGKVTATLTYPEYNFEYSIVTFPSSNNALTVQVLTEAPLPSELEGVAGFNLEFLPSAYFGKSYLLDGNIGHLPRYPRGPMTRNEAGKSIPLPLASGHSLTLSPEDPTSRVSIRSSETELCLYDGRNKAQNGWYVVRSILPTGRKGVLLEWTISASTDDTWLREPNIGFSQVGYHPDQPKRAIIELDKNATPEPAVQLYRIAANGEREEVLSTQPKNWGRYLRYNYLEFDFSKVTATGLYQIQYGNTTSPAFPISNDVYSNIWHATLDTYLPIQMDHVLVNEAYRVWHGASHLDDARQAPPNHEHFDLYAQGSTTDTQFAPGEHSPGLNIGGWYDAGDYDIRTQTQYHAVHNLVHTYEDFGIQRDNTTVDRPRKFVDLHQPDGYNDIQQQIEHGALALIAQHRAVGHAIPGIIVPNISQYTHLGDGLTMTDNLIYDSSLSELESDGLLSGVPDDRWAFTSRSSALSYGSAAGLAAASRALRDYNEDLAEECLQTALRVWSEEESKEPDTFRHGNTTGGRLDDEKLKAASELLLATHDPKYAKAMDDLWSRFGERFLFVAEYYLRVKSQLLPSTQAKLKSAIVTLLQNQKEILNANPYGVPITEGGWAGSGAVVRYGITNYLIHREYPELADLSASERSLAYMLGNHPAHNLSLVSAVGAESKTVAYGMNRADFSFIAGGVVPGILVLKPDFPENKEDWPFLWGENEYVINVATSYLYLANAILSERN